MAVSSNNRSVTALEGARERMVQTQLLDRGVNDPRVIHAMRKVPRHLFVEPALVNRAYDDDPLPIGAKQTISQPYIVGYMLQALGLKGTERVLEIGTGSAYQTALLAELCANVFSVEKLRRLAVQGRAVLDELRYYNVAIHVGDGTLGWSEHAPYDAIVVAAGAPRVPEPLAQQLAGGGRLIIPIGDQTSQVLKLASRTPSGLEETSLGECRFVKLLGKYGWPS
ncbi:MAG: protein-L-isoaspartate(D-aspartate) O-methyltransferase [Deltaproteobacteria bacterium]|nr:protein-L-isoaspartate(D-aspartate) O-methyltransferase [Deltaproteobacteria bacterium]